VGKRQVACSAPECQRRRRQDTLASWWRRNPEYKARRRLTKLAKRIERGERPDAPSPGPPLHRLPWEVGQDQFGDEGAAFLVEFGKVLDARRQD
jgi:hypothetical protein